MFQALTPHLGGDLGKSGGGDSSAASGAGTRFRLGLSLLGNKEIEATRQTLVTGTELRNVQILDMNPDSTKGRREPFDKLRGGSGAPARFGLSRKSVVG